MVGRKINLLKLRSKVTNYNLGYYPILITFKKVITKIMPNLVSLYLTNSFNYFILRGLKIKKRSVSF